MRGGKLRKRITIQQADGSARDAHGAISRKWADKATVWAAIEPIKGRESWQGMAVSTKTTHGIIMRFFRGLTADMRLVYAPPNNQGAPRIFNIEGILNKEERSIEHDLTVIEGSPNG